MPCGHDYAYRVVRADDGERLDREVEFEGRRCFRGGDFYLRDRDR